jgi:hypothetical protein
MSLWVFGGQQRPAFGDNRRWEGFELGVVVRLDDDGTMQRTFEYRLSSGDSLPSLSSHLLTGSTIVGDTAYVCTPTEIAVCSFPGFTVQRVISHPFFNDLHHVAVSPAGTLYVAVTGLDAVAELSLDGELIRLKSTVEGVDVWDRFSPDVDYRRCVSTKPHASHPNFVFFVNGEACVTRFVQRDAIRLDGGERIGSLHEGMHDGCVVGDEVYFTTVDGHLAAIDHRTGAVRTVDLNAMAPNPGFPLGWCRGLLVQGARAWVGFSRLRFSRFRQNVSWIRHGFKPSYHHRNPTRLMQFDLREPACLREVDLEPMGVNAVFSVLEA